MGDRARIPCPESYLPLPPAVLDIMVALGNEEMHGYAIMQEVRRRTDGQRRLAPGTLYRSLKQMHERGLVAVSEERPDPSLDDERRRYYRLTDLGRRVTLAEVERLEGLVGAARSKGFAPSTRPSGAGRGKLTAVGAALETSLTVEEAERMLQALAAKGHLESSCSPMGERGCVP